MNELLHKQWKPSNVGLDDVVLEQTAWSAKPHGSQFKIIEDVPSTRLAIKIQKPPQLERNDVLKSINFDDSWVQIL